MISHVTMDYFYFAHESLWLFTFIYSQLMGHGPSHGGSYMDESMSHIRIRLPPHVVSGDCLTSILCLCYIHCPLMHIRCSGWYRVVLVHCIRLWAPEGCYLLPILSVCMVSHISWRTTTFTIGGEHRSLHLLMLCWLPYDSITDSHYTWITVLWLLVW